MHYEVWSLFLIYALWTLAAWFSVGAYLLVWESMRPGGRPRDAQVRKQILWFALKTALIVAVAITREYR